MTYMTEQDESKYTDIQLFRMWKEQNPNTLLNDLANFKNSEVADLEKFKMLKDFCKVPIVKPKVIETHPLFVNGFINKVVA